MTTKKLKPVRTVSGSEVRAGLRGRIREFELRYEMPTSKMRKLVMLGERPDTAEIAAWLQDAEYLELLERAVKNTAGSASSPTSKSTKAP